jgi:replicative DNA helicase
MKIKATEKLIMKNKKIKEVIQDKIDAAVEAPIHEDQRDIEAVGLATLAEVINSDVSDLKYSLLELDPADFYFRDHRDAFAAMKELNDAGDRVDQLTVQAKGAAWPDMSKAKLEAAETYKRQIIARANICQAAKIGRDFQRRVS